MKAPRLGMRSALAVLIGSVAFVLVWIKTANGALTDFDLVWYGARALWSGENPYAVIGPGRPFAWPFPLLYPLTAVITVLPLAALPAHLARSLFAGLGAAVFTFAISKEGFVPLLVLLSPPFTNAIRTAQWTPLLAAMYLMPGLGWLVVAKPNVGLPILAANPQRMTIVAGIVGMAIVLVSLVILPRWPMDWISVLPAGSHLRMPIAAVGGPFLLLALLRWRRREARLLVALSCVPQTTCLYSALPVMLCSHGFGETAGLVILSQLSWFLPPSLIPGFQWNQGYVDPVAARLMNLFYYLPALVLVLRRPNESFRPLVERETRWDALARGGAPASSRTD